MISFLLNVNILGWDLQWIRDVDKGYKPDIGIENSEKVDKLSTSIANVGVDGVDDLGIGTTNTDVDADRNADADRINNLGTCTEDKDIDGVDNLGKSIADIDVDKAANNSAQA